MIYLLYGPDEYRLNEKLLNIKQEYAKKFGSSLCFEKIDLALNDEEVFWKHLNQNSLFVSKKLVVAENIFSSPGFKKNLLKKIKEFSTSEHILIFIERKEIKPSDAIFLALKENGKVQDFSILVGKKLEGWAKNLFAQFGCQISEQALKNLLLSTGNDLYLLSNEIKKLSLYKKEIVEKDIALLVRPSTEIEIFKTIDALLSRNKKEALFALQGFVDSRGSLFYLLSMLAFQMRNLLMVKIAQDLGHSPQSLGMHPFVFKKSLALVRSISLEQLKLSLKNIFLADLKTKTGQESPEEVVRSLVLSM